MNDTTLSSRPAREQVAGIVIEAVQEALALAGGESAAPQPVTEDTFLIGQSAVLDSMGLVSAILDIEQRLADDYDIVLVLADERAMSQKNSPFRSVRSLTDYVCRRIDALAVGSRN
jgi:acyl carrier protein